ncbi:MAG: hypothetical protein H7Z74_13975 [Anaerolineae bacterium]|nr:hypothetical protein [Gemmatimonadaceae bacterium]
MQNDMRHETPPPMRRIEEVLSPTLPLPPPRGDDELDRFLAAVAATGVGDRELIRTTIAGFDHREDVAATCHRALAARPCGEVGRFMMVLSVVGELRHDSSLEPLEAVTWAADADLLGSAYNAGARAVEGSACEFPASGMIQSRAAEMFTWVAAGRFDDRVLKIVTSHPSVATRLAAADAFLFHHQDSARALETVLAVAQPMDRKGIGVPRLWSDVDPEVFAERLAAANALTEAAPLPRKVGRDDGDEGATNVY